MDFNINAKYNISKTRIDSKTLLKVSSAIKSLRTYRADNKYRITLPNKIVKSYKIYEFENGLIMLEPIVNNKKEKGEN